MAETRARGKLLVGGVVLVIVVTLMVIALIYSKGSGPPLPGLADELAAMVNRSPEVIRSNLPPIDGRYPGAVFVEPVPGQAAPIRRQTRPHTVPPVTGEVRGARAVIASGLLEGKMRSVGGSASSSTDLDVTVDLTELRVFETDLGGELKSELLADQDVRVAQSRGLNPQLVFRSYEAIPVLNVRQGAAASAEVWGKSKASLLKAGATIGEGGTLRISAGEPVVVAFETVAVEYVATNFAPEGQEVKLITTTAPGLDHLPIDAKAFGMGLGSHKVGFVGFGTQTYHSVAFGNLDEVPASLDLAAAALTAAGASQLATPAPNPTATTQDAVASFLDAAAQDAKSKQLDLLVVYYVGHTVAMRGGQLYLVLSAYTGNLADDMGEELMLGLPRAELTAPTAPLSGSNIGDILDVLNAAQGEFPEEIEGLYAVSEMHKRLTNAGIPFAIVVDGCFGSESMDKLRDALSLTRSGDYYGPADVPTQEMGMYMEAIRQFGVAPYLHSSNPIIVSAKPGSVAVPVAHPVFAWSLAPKVGPLSARLHRRLIAALAHGEELSWGAYLRSLADFGGTGELSTTGSITWSEFETLRSLPMLKPTN